MKKHFPPAIICLLTWPLLAAEPAESAALAYWPQWRGPLASGVAPQADPPLAWSETNNVRWKVKIPGAGTDTAKVASEQSLAGRGDSDYESDYFGARAMQNLGRKDEAKLIFKALVKTGEEQLAKGEGPDYFAKFGEKTSERVRLANAHYLIGLGRLGMGEKEKANASFQKALELRPAHLGAREQSRAAVAR